MNTKILLRTINDLENLQTDLKNKGFDFRIDEEKIEVNVEYANIEIFREIIKTYLNAKYNYVNIKFPNQKLNILVFIDKTFFVNDKAIDISAKEWALSIGLSKPETEWTTFY